MPTLVNRESREAIARWNGVICAMRMPLPASMPGAGEPLNAVSISIKDVIDVAGWTVTCNHRGFAGRLAEADADIIVRLRGAGAAFVGSTGTLEFAYGTFAPTSLYPHARNPWNVARSPGGSSAGAGAAVAAGFCDAAIATDTSGSVRGPAANCGVLGLKLTHGTVSMVGVYPLAPSLDCVGVLARDADILGQVSSVLCGQVLVHGAVTPRRIGRVRGFDEGAGVMPEVAAALNAAADAFRQVGVEIVDIALSELETYHAACIVILLYEAWQIHGARLQSERDSYAPETWARLALGAFVSLPDYEAALALRERLIDEIDDALAGVGLLMFGAAPSGAPEMGTAALFGMLRQRFLTAPASVTGHPAISIPIGFDGDKMPLAMQIIGQRGGEATLVQVARLYQSISQWHHAWPPLVRYAPTETA